MKPKPVDWYCFDADDNATREWYPQGLDLRLRRRDRRERVRGELVPRTLVGGRAGHTPVVPGRGVAPLPARPAGTARADGNIAPINIPRGRRRLVRRAAYVADTSRGLRVFDIRHIYEIDGDDKNTIGKKGGVHNAFGYRYVMPQTGAWVSTGTATFSFAAIDRTTEPDSLISGEYVDTPGKFGRVARWPLTSGGSLRADAGGAASALDAYRLPETKIQGALSYNGTWYLSQAGGSTKNGTLAVVGDTIKKRPYPVGPEDLSYLRRDKKTLWSVTEFAGRRAGVRRAAVDAAGALVRPPPEGEHRRAGHGREFVRAPCDRRACAAGERGAWARQLSGARCDRRACAARESAGLSAGNRRPGADRPPVRRRRRRTRSPPAPRRSS